jgi:hypothetical protein
MSAEDDRAVRSEPVTTDEGDEVVVSQQNVGPGSQIGGGEFKNVERGKTPEEAAAAYQIPPKYKDYKIVPFGAGLRGNIQAIYNELKK